MIFDASSTWIIAISVGIILAVMVSSFFAYLCGCCTKIQSRDELIGLSGVVKITNPDADHNNVPVAIWLSKTPSDHNIATSSISSSNASAKRLNGVSGNNACNPGTATRSLPELPVGAAISSSSGRNDSAETNFVGYSGVGDTNSDLYATLEEHKIGTSVIPKSQLPQNGTLHVSTATSSLATRTYEQINEDTTYNKLKEHPYAQVENDTDSPTYEPKSGSLERRSESTEDEVDGHVNIPAASAIAGGVAASSELPYMTPPIHTDHFSGDSQDSAKGYTSITVREPLARIRPNIITNPITSDSHYTVLSEDSADEMYAAIQEAYTSGSETYAQIQPVLSDNPTYCCVPETISEASTSQKFASSTMHSRQPSTSSIASTLTNRNSPKEKRQANSPLPKPPDISADDMYAKVLKKRRNESDRCSSRDSVYHSDPDTAAPSPIFPGGGTSSIVDKVEHREDREKSEKRVDTEDDDPDRYACGYETLPERNYEMLAESNSSLGYETVNENFHLHSGYETLPEMDSLTAGYERIRELNGGYEKIKYATKEDESDPNYEELKPQPGSEQFHCYATINKGTRSANLERLTEPDYASLTKHATGHVEDDNGMENDPFYERIRRRRLSSNSESNNNQEVKFNDNNNNRSNSLPKDDMSECQSVSETNLNDLYSKVNKNIKR